ncbi:MAG TPA: O-antigen ligase family protein [Pyrinomonadaceae bacterium]|nr:O-antigen ligase family protein [Pyrinomonadaceae bacterium]
MSSLIDVSSVGPRASVRGEPAVRAGAYEASAFVRWTFYAFVFSLPFETIEWGPLEPPTVLGALLLAGCALLQPGLLLRWPPAGFWCFLAYVYVSVALGALEFTRHRSEVTHDLFLLVQLTTLCWIAYCLMRDERVAAGALGALVAACALLALLQVTGVASKATDVGAKVERVTALGFHPNNLARIFALGLLALVGLTYARRQALLRPRYLAWPAVALVGVALVQTGSRGGLLALGAGLSVFVLGGGSLWSKARNLVGVGAVALFFVFVGVQSEVTRGRFEKTLEEGDLARREEIYPSAWRMFREKPLLGWGGVTSTYELGSRLGHPEEESKNPHNLILYALVSAGLAGTLPLLAGLAMCARAAWRSRRGAHGVLPLVLAVAVLTANMSSLWLFNKLHWLVMAYALASVSYCRLPIGGWRLRNNRPAR